MKIEFPDGSKKEYKKPVSGLDIAKEISEGLARAALAIEVNGELKDLNTVIDKDAKIRIITWKDKEGVEIFRHSSAHLLAEAVLRIFPKAKPTIGPAVEEGFYYDFAMPALKPEDLEKIEAEIKKIIKEKKPFERKEVSKKDALKLFKDNKYKVEMINDLEEGSISTYQMGSFIDLCRGPHVPDTGHIKAVKLLKVSSAYWRGDAKNDSLQRIYGISFPDKKDLKAYLDLLEEAKKRDHKKIGKEMELFSIHEEGPGFPFFHHKGLIIWNKLLDLWRDEHRKAGYVEQKTPIILHRKLWETSGHWENYRENMYTLKIDNQDFAIKPMNCPGGMLLYREKVHSYKELPLRAGEIGLVHRHEMSGVLNGLFRVRAFHQDDAHIFMTNEQIKDEILGVMNLVDKFYKIFGLDYHVELSTRPEKSVGTDEQWETATKGLKAALDSTGKEYKINEGDGAFYGPKIDFHIKDSLGRTWQCATIQLDMSLPERFDLTYDGQDGRKHRPVMIHRVIYGALERFLGILIEHYAGKFPLWLSPNQVKVLTVASRNDEYAQKVVDKLKEEGFLTEPDFRSESVPKKVRDAQIQQFNYILVIGDKEQENKSVNVRTRDNKVLGEKKLDALMKDMKKEIESKK
ncbi:threonine--tRNA ligase [Candidatus Woesearchaeota archaeon]|nr:threonine--tRNA ligase [Candidatus Woesearchaeota archaeon]